jgi:hypothetical protein
MKPEPKRRYFRTITFFIITCLITSCTPDLDFLQLFRPTPAAVINQSSQDLQLAMVKFEAVNLQGDSSGGLTIEILDEVTGLALNPSRYNMRRISAGRYAAEIAIPVGSVIKYRYLRGTSPYVVEYSTSGTQVRYRMYHVITPSVVQDIIAAWTDFKYSGPSGRIMGQVINPENNSPIPSGLVLAGGLQTLTASDGTFLLEGLPPGLHNLVVYSIDGSFETFQQGALVSENATTPALIHTKIAPLVTVTFVVQTPPANVKGLPVRMIGNLYALGNTFADLEGGTSVVAARAPIITLVSDGFYTTSLRLPVGFDLRYKYTLGDGFWNAEHALDSSFVTRQLIIPDSDITITETVETWQSGTQEPITYLVRVPENTPLEDTISIQFNPYGWTSPIPMWPVGDNRWLYVLYSPLNMMGSFGYRYCRNDLCGIADDTATAGRVSTGIMVTPSEQAQVIQDVVQSWVGWDTNRNATSLQMPEITPRGDAFIAGIELNPNYTPLWQPYQFWGLNKINLLGATWAILSPSWVYTRSSPPVIEPVTGKSPLWFDTAQTIQTTRQNNLTPALFPRLDDRQLFNELWEEPITETSWWQNWFERYRIFVLNYADLATQTNTPLLILGGPEIIPAIPGGTLPDGNPSGVPDFAEEKWQEILLEVRERYTGAIAWAIPYPSRGAPTPDWLGQVDIIYVLISAPLETAEDIGIEQLQSSFSSILDQEIFPLYESNLKPVVIGINYPATDNAADGCYKDDNLCITLENILPSFEGTSSQTINLQTQADIYQAALTSVNERDWIAGFVSRGFYTPAAIQDGTSSIHGKPASDVIWNWFPKILGREIP